jgi:NitT/TauT family transport system substrate-binding protein
MNNLSFKFLRVLWIFSLISVVYPNYAKADYKKVHVGVLAYGTVNWELDTVKHHQLDKKEKFDLNITKLGSKNATAVALQGNEVDAIVTDWLWVSRQRNSKKYYTFVPHSIAVGGLMVRPDANIKSLKDLSGLKLGIAGGPVDKSWLMLRAYSKKLIGKDLKEIVRPTYAAPPLLNKIMLKGDIPAILNFWHYNAKLKAAGMTEFLSIDGLLPALGIKTTPPLIGWVFDERWAKSNLDTVQSFFRCLRAAKQILASSDSEWDRLRPLTKAKNDKTFEALKSGYRKGIPKSFNDKDIAAATSLFSILVKYGGRDLIGNKPVLAPGTFWSGFRF